jgi:hypothetical protein
MMAAVASAAMSSNIRSVDTIHPKPMTSGAKSDGRFGKQDFAYLSEEDAYRCPAG